MNWELRTVLVVLIDFLIPATVLGMIGPVVAKMAVEQARRAGSAIGDVYFWGAVGSIAGTFLCGFVLAGPVRHHRHHAAGRRGAGAAGRGADDRRARPRSPRLLAAVLLVLGSIRPLVERIGPGGRDGRPVPDQLLRGRPATSSPSSWPSPPSRAW